MLLINLVARIWKVCKYDAVTDLRQEVRGETMFPMTRRKDTKTAELVEIALLTRSAFEQDRAERYADIAGIPEEIIGRIFSRVLGSFRRVDSPGSAGVHADRRKLLR